MILFILHRVFLIVSLFSAGFHSESERPPPGSTHSAMTLLGLSQCQRLRYWGRRQTAPGIADGLQTPVFILKISTHSWRQGLYWVNLELPKRAVLSFTFRTARRPREAAVKADKSESDPRPVYLIGLGHWGSHLALPLYEVSRTEAQKQPM